MAKTIKENISNIYKTVKDAERFDSVLVLAYYSKYEKQVPNKYKTSPETICRTGRKIRGGK